MLVPIRQSLTTNRECKILRTSTPCHRACHAHKHPIVTERVIERRENICMSVPARHLITERRENTASCLSDNSRQQRENTGCPSGSSWQHREKWHVCAGEAAHNDRQNAQHVGASQASHNSKQSSQEAVPRHVNARPAAHNIVQRHRVSVAVRQLTTESIVV